MVAVVNKKVEEERTRVEEERKTVEEERKIE